jgi:hypothetical protein
MARCKSCGVPIPLGKDYCSGECFRARFETLRRRPGPVDDEEAQTRRYFREYKVIR